MRLRAAGLLVFCLALSVSLPAQTAPPAGGDCLWDTLNCVAAELKGNGKWPQNSNGTYVTVKVSGGGPPGGVSATAMTQPTTIGPVVTLFPNAIAQLYGADAPCDPAMITQILLHEFEHCQYILNGTLVFGGYLCEEAAIKANDLGRLCDLACEQASAGNAGSLADLCTAYAEIQNFFNDNSAGLMALCGIPYGTVSNCPCCP